MHAVLEPLEQGTALFPTGFEAAINRTPCLISHATRSDLFPTPLPPSLPMKDVTIDASCYREGRILGLLVYLDDSPFPLFKLDPPLVHASQHNIPIWFLDQTGIKRKTQKKKKFIEPGG